MVKLGSTLPFSVLVPLGKTRPRVLSRLWGWLPLVALTLTACGEGGSPTATNPINDGISGTRVATPAGQSFSESEPGRGPIGRSLVASFVLSPEQLTAAATGEVRIQPEQLTLCVDCSGLSPGDPSDEGARGLGTYEAEDIALHLRIPQGIVEGQLQLDSRIEIDSTTPFINPGQGIRLTVRQAGMVLNDDRIEAAQTGDPLDFRATQITQGLSTSQSLSLGFDVLSPLEDRELHLEVQITSPIPNQALAAGQLALPPEGRMYAGTEGSVDRVARYESAVGQPPAWVYFEQQDGTFPVTTAQQLRQQGSVPYVRLLLPSDTETLAAISDGEQDEAWSAWLDAIQTIAAPVMVEVGQSSGDPEALRTAYRYVERLRQEKNVSNLTWVYHLDLALSTPDGDYPGDDMIGWINLNATVETTADGTWRSLRAQLDDLYPQATLLSSTKPILLTLQTTPTPQEAAGLDWVTAGLSDLAERRWPRIRGLTWAQGWDPSASSGLAEILAASIGQSAALLGRVQVSATGATTTIQPLDSASPTPSWNNTFSPAPTPDPFFETEDGEPIP